MFSENWSVDQIEKELALKFGMLITDQQYDQQSVSAEAEGEVVARLGHVLMRMSDVLDNQSLFQSEIRSLRDEVQQLRAERGEMEASFSERIRRMEHEVARLRERRAASAGEEMNFPSEEFLSKPLVIQSEGEYLGVQGQGRKPFSLKDFVLLIERNVSDRLDVETAWSQQDGCWVFKLKTVARGGVGRSQDVVLVVKETVTPNRNVVSEIVRLNIDGKDAPDALLLSLFRQLKSVFSD